MYSFDSRVVLTLDAGGTNFVFSAVKAYSSLVEPVHKKAVADNAEACLECIADGFREVIKRLGDQKPVAISFAFPGPADYKAGIIGDLPNFPGFRGGVAMGPYLSAEFGIPVFINNDGNLYAFGEAIAGALPKVNKLLKTDGGGREYSNIVGITLGTGFGCGVVIDGRLLTGDNGCGGDVWLMRNSRYPQMLAEESVSIRAVKRVYSELSGLDASNLNPKDIYDIAEGTLEGDREAARGSFAQLGEVAADAIASALNIADGIVTIGGGVAGAAKYIMPALVARLNSCLTTFAGGSFPCTQMKVYNLQDEQQLCEFLKDESSIVKVPGKDLHVKYTPVKKTGVMVSEIGASTAIFYGAYAYALSELDKKENEI